MRLSILGGSTPFTLEFFLALERNPLGSLEEVVLFGRNQLALEHIARFGQRRLDVPVKWTQDQDDACSGFDVIVHQIRYGGLAGRDADEQLAVAAGTVPDESLGTAAISAVARMRAPLARVCAAICAHSPGAHVINMTNPLGLSTSLMKQAGIANPIGICELPAVTAAAAASICGLDPAEMTWDYHGLNHRGFLYGLAGYGDNLLARIANSGVSKPFGGLGGEQLLQFGALPTKYFQLFMSGQPISAPGRAASLNQLRDAILAELIADPTRAPASLARRDQPWWALSVVPLLHALAADAPSRHIVNLTGADGITREGWARVSRESIELIAPPPLPAHPAQWVAVFEAHERAALRYAMDPRDDLRDAADLADPLSRSFTDPGLWRPRLPPAPRS